MTEAALPAERQQVRAIQEARTRGIPHWPSSLDDTADVMLRGRYRDITYQLDRIERGAAEIHADSRLSDVGKRERLAQLSADVMAEIERRNNTAEAERQLTQLEKAINAKIDAALNDPGRQSRNQQILSWLTSLPKEQRGDAWRHAHVHHDHEFTEAVAAMNRTIQKTILGFVQDETLDEIRAGLRERYAADETAEQARLTVEIEVLKKAVQGALRYARGKTL